MSSRRIDRRCRSLACRLTIWYAGVFTVSSVIAFLIFYFLFSSLIRDSTDRDLIADTTEFASLMASKGLDETKSGMELEVESEGVDKVFIRVLTPGGSEVAATNTTSWKRIEYSRKALEKIAAGADYVLETKPVARHGNEARIIYAPIGHSFIFQMGKSLVLEQRLKGAFRAVFAIFMGAVIILSALIGWFMAKRALLGVEEVTRTAMEISKGKLDRRVFVAGQGDEIERLATAFNAMLDRVKALIGEMEEMTDNIAHDLRSPVTRIRGIAEMALTSGARSMSDYEETASNTVEECDRLLEMINTMLEISEAEAGVAKFRKADVDMAEVVRDACDLFQALAEDNSVELVSRIPDPCDVCGDRQKLQRMVANLLDNAIKYTSPAGRVAVSVNGDSDWVKILIEDSGIGIPPEELPHIFKRFYRCDRSRSRRGTGLGLSLALAIARAHGGDISVESTPGEGSRFMVNLPLLS